MSELLYGTSSWTAKGWVGPFYPEGTQPAEFLPHYARHFRAVEADTTYYGVPKPTTVENWAKRTPDGFRMCAKFPRAIVHGGEGPRPDPRVVLEPEHVAAETKEFLAVMGLLGDKCGPLVLQFPYFNRDVFDGPGEFLARLDHFLGMLPSRFRYAVELRNRAWIKPPLLRVLRRRRTALVLVEIGYMPHPAELWAQHDLITTDFAYARLIGDRKAVDARTKTFDRIVVDQAASLQRWADVMREVLARVPVTYAFANNHFAGHGPQTIRDLAALLVENIGED